MSRIPLLHLYLQQADRSFSIAKRHLATVTSPYHHVEVPAALGLHSTLIVC